MEGKVRMRREQGQRGLARERLPERGSCCAILLLKLLLRRLKSAA